MSYVACIALSGYGSFMGEYPTLSGTGKRKSRSFTCQRGVQCHIYWLKICYREYSRWRLSQGRLYQERRTYYKICRRGFAGTCLSFLYRILRWRTCRGDSCRSFGCCRRRNRFRRIWFGTAIQKFMAGFFCKSGRKRRLWNFEGYICRWWKQGNHSCVEIYRYSGL